MTALAEILYRATGLDIDVVTLLRILTLCLGGILFSLLMYIDGLTAFH
jgi:phage shock protein PspC (stress-responsive transcriptional regulator)